MCGYITETAQFEIMKEHGFCAYAKQKIVVSYLTVDTHRHAGHPLSLDTRHKELSIGFLSQTTTRINIPHLMLREVV